MDWGREEAGEDGVALLLALEVSLVFESKLTRK